VFDANNRSRKNTSVSSASSASGRTDGVTILRPLKGIDNEMDSCLTSAFLQDFPKFEIIFCVASEADPAIPVVRELITKYSHVDAKLMVGESQYGPNPKINNLAKGYEAAQYDIIWVLDSNVWVSPGTLARSVDAFYSHPSIALVHHMPICVSTDPSWRGNMGGKLDEMFMLTSHSKFYSAINTAALAPCVMGKSNLYRRSGLDRATGREHGQGIQVFAQYIAEDNMIADALWKSGGRTAMTSDSVIQPLGTVSFDGYISRRVRWLRVRRYMVLAATMLEPTTESIVCGVFGAFGVSVLVFSQPILFSWTFFVVHMVIWCLADYWHFHNLLGFGNVERFLDVPYFVSKFYSPESTEPIRRGFFSLWLPIWLLRETLAFPIWVIAMSGHKILWRNRPFRIKRDMTAEEIIE
jgi:ceramide glucosyltransferase